MCLFVRWRPMRRRATRTRTSRCGRSSFAPSQAARVCSRTGAPLSPPRTATSPSSTELSSPKGQTTRSQSGSSTGARSSRAQRAPWSRPTLLRRPQQPRSSRTRRSPQRTAASSTSTPSR
eukprot:Amastigsp_a686655_3.p3 type:complete len:120 gc:universal Amastigsp_a686655_3:123-482(+)